MTVLTSEQKDQISKEREELAKLRWDLSLKSEKRTHQLRQHRKTIARLLTQGNRPQSVSTSA